MTPSHGIDLDQYRTQGKDLLKLARSGDVAALERIRQSHPEQDALLASGRFQLADAQLVIARENGFASWPRFKEDLLYLQAVRAIDEGDLPRLETLLDKHPRLISQRRRVGEWYAEGYFQGAMLLHHVAGNPIRHPLPGNVVEVTRLLLSRGADPNAATDSGTTTIGLILTGKQPSDAGVALPLIDLLQAAGARYNPDDPELLTMPLLNAAPGTAEELARRGAKMDLRHAAGLGRLDVMEALLAQGVERPLLEEALAFACVRGRQEAAALLVRHGAKGDVLVTHGGRSPCTALHEAANRGHAGIVRLLVENGADSTVVEPHWGGTPAGWARHGGHGEIAAMLEDAASGSPPAPNPGGAAGRRNPGR